MNAHGRNEPFIRAAFWDGVVRTVSTIFQNLAGKSLLQWNGALISTAVIELVRFNTGVLTLLSQRGKIGVHRSAALLMFVWAFFAVLMTVLHIYSYEVGADQGIATLLIMGAIVPGTMIDRFIFGERISARRNCSVIIFLIAAWFAVGFPGLVTSLDLPWWVGYKVLISFMLAVNEGVRRKLAGLPQEQQVSGAQAQFWVGLFSLVLVAAIGLIAGFGGGAHNYPTSFWIASLGMGGAVAISTILSVWVYQLNGSITARKLISSTTLLVLTMLTGMLLFDEALTWGKILAVPTFIVSLALYATDSRR